MPKTVCKFTVTAVETAEYNAGEEIITMSPLYDESDPEDTKFSKYTPWGNLNFGLSNPNLVGKFEVGQVYHLHLVPIEEDPSRGRFIN